MSELDLGATGGQPAAAAAAAPAAQPVAGGLVLEPPQPVAAVPEEQAAGAVPVPDAKKTELAQRAAAFANELAAMDTRTPEFAQEGRFHRLDGRQGAARLGGVSNRMLDRPAAVARSGKGGGVDAQTRVAGTLNELRNTVTDLDPNRADLTGVKKVLKWIPGGDRIQKYFQKYESAQTQLNAIIKSLDSGQDDLRKDNAAIETEKQNMWTTMGKLSEYNALATALDDAVTQKVAELEAAGNTEAANTLKSDALFAIRQRRQDIMTQMAVSVQGYMALDLVRKNNLELIKGVDRAQTTTISALRTAVIVSQALARQKLVLDQITALNTTTSNLIESTSQQLRTQGAEINQQAASSTIDVQKLQAAFDNVFQTMDAIDSFRAQSVDSMAQTVTALRGPDRARPARTSSAPAAARAAPPNCRATPRPGSCRRRADPCRGCSAAGTTTRPRRRPTLPAASLPATPRTVRSSCRNGCGRWCSSSTAAPGSCPSTPSCSPARSPTPCARSSRRRPTGILMSTRWCRSTASSATTCPRRCARTWRSTRRSPSGTGRPDARRAPRCASSWSRSRTQPTRCCRRSHAHDVDALFTQGNFLRTKYTRSDLDL